MAAGTGSPLICTVVSDPAELERLRPEWLDLLARSAANEAMLTPAWLLTWWRVYGPREGRRLRAALFRDGNRLVGLAPLLLRRHWYPPGLPFRRLEPLGSGEPDEDAVCSDYLNVIAERGAEAEVAGALARALQGHALGSWDELVLPTMDGTGPLPGLLSAALGRAGLRTEVAVTGAAPYIPLPATWGEYLRGLTKKHRYSIVHALREFERWAGGGVRLERADSPAAVEEGRRILVALHQERWQHAGQPGAFASPLFRAFHEAVLPQLFEAGALELRWLWARGEPVAALYGLDWGGKVSYYQCGRKMALPRNVRPGIALLAHTIRAAIEAGRREFDFLDGTCLYKGQLAPASRPLVRLRAARGSLRERTRRFLVLAKRVLRKAIPGSRRLTLQQEVRPPDIPPAGSRGRKPTLSPTLPTPRPRNWSGNHFP